MLTFRDHLSGLVRGNPVDGETKIDSIYNMYNIGTYL